MSSVLPTESSPIHKSSGSTSASNRVSLWRDLLAIEAERIIHEIMVRSTED